MVFEVSEEIANLIAKAGISPPICFGRVQVATFASRSGFQENKVYIGLCSERDMSAEMERRSEELSHTTWTR